MSTVSASSSASFSTNSSNASFGTSNPITPEAALQFGIKYLEGIGFQKNEGQAYSFLKLAADMGNAEAQVRTARCLEKGKGITQNLDEAFAFYEKAAKQGRQKDFFDFGVRLQNQGIIKRTQNLASEAQNLLAKAFTCFQGTADMGNADAQNLTGRCLEEGYGTTKNATLATEYYEQAARRGHKEALCNLGMQLQSQGKYVDAYKKFFAAAQDGSPNACYSLARCYKKGLGVTKDISSAMFYYQKAAIGGISEALSEMKKLSEESTTQQSTPQPIISVHTNASSSSFPTSGVSASTILAQPTPQLNTDPSTLFQPLLPKTVPNYGSSDPSSSQTPAPATAAHVQPSPQLNTDSSTLSQPLLQQTDASTFTSSTAAPTTFLAQPPPPPQPDNGPTVEKPSINQEEGSCCC